MYKTAVYRLVNGGIVLYCIVLLLPVSQLQQATDVVTNYVTLRIFNTNL